jgi:hypothetical protein
MGRKVSIGNTAVNYPTSFEGTEVQNLIEDEVVSGSRWDVNITTGAKEYNARIEAELVSGRIFYLALGYVTPGLDSVPCTIYPSEALPESNIIGNSEGGSISIKNAKCNRLRINWDAGEFVNYEAEFQGTISATNEAALGATDWSVLATTGGSVMVILDGNTLDEVQSGNLEINNNLEARYACGKGKQPTKLREQRLEVSGAITVGQADTSLFTSGGHSLQVRILGVGTTGGYIQIICGSIWFEELPTEFSGHDVYEVEYSWVGQPITGGNIIKVIDNSGVQVY